MSRCPLATDDLGSFERKATHKDPELPKQELLARVEQVMAPLDRRADGLLARRKVLCPAGEELQPALQSRQHSLRGQ